jgi:hypothetical protein
MEYLMTYGWAILVIAVVLGVLFQLGVFSASSFSVRAPSGACQVFRPGGPGTTTNVNLVGQCNSVLPKYVAQFNGASSYVDAPSTAGPRGPFTIAMWINFANGFPGNGLYATAIAQGPTWNYATSSFSLYFGGSGYIGLNFRIECTDAVCAPDNSLVYNPFSTPFPSGWQHYVGVFDGSSLAMYMNGTLKGSWSFGPVTLHTSTDHVQIQGSYAGYPGSGNTLMISNVQLYNKPLASDEVKTLYLEGVGGVPLAPPNVIAWWPLNGDAKDYSGNGNTGVPTAVSYVSQYGK